MSDEEYNPFPDIPSAVSFYTRKINASFPMLRQKQTGFHEVDVKRFEARQCVVFELGISAIVMSCVALEECLKTLLKYHYFFQNVETRPEVTLKQWEETGLQADDAYGAFSLHNAIQKARKENLITEAEEKVLLEIKDFVRNAFVHSDKSKIFDPQSKIEARLVKLEQGEMKVKGDRMMSLVALNVAQGLAEKELANTECRGIHEQIDAAILTICERFWQSHSTSHSTSEDGNATAG
ncbi:hypothetical protein ACFL09_05270 [Planctomycetota bacterium]